MMRRRVVVLVSILAVLSCLVSGCATPQAEPVVSASPTFRCTTADPLSPGPCSQADWEAQQADEALYQEAVAVYTRFFNENQRIERAGGVTEPTPELLATTTDPMTRELMRFYRFQYDEKITISGELTKLQTFRTDKRRDGAIIAIKTCEDGRGVITTTADGQDVSVPGFIILSIQFKRVDGILKAFAFPGKRADQCT